jgi:hypothetical protein
MSEPLRTNTAGGRLAFAVTGVLAALAGMAAGHLVAALVDPATSPVLSVGSTVIDLTPTPLKELAIAKFGTADKAILLASVGLVTVLLAATAGLLSRRRPRVGLGLLVVLVVLAGAAAMTRPTATLPDLLPALATGVVGINVLVRLRRQLIRAEKPARAFGTEEPAGAAPATRDGSRRQFLVGAAGVTAGPLLR